jgi:hypothetical protein
MSPSSHCHYSTLKMEAETASETSVQETLAVRWLTVLKNSSKDLFYNCILLSLTTGSVNYKLSVSHLSAIYTHTHTHTHDFSIFSRKRS